jgi:hypothetical protein
MGSSKQRIENLIGGHMMGSVRAISQTIDIVYSEDDGGYYLQEYKLDGKGTTRTSQIFATPVLAKAALRISRTTPNAISAVKWSKWD